MNGNLLIVNAATAAVLGAAIGAAATLLTQTLTSLNTLTQTREARNETRRVELAGAIRDFLEEAQKIEAVIAWIIREGKDSPNVSFEELWLRQKLIQVFSEDQKVSQACIQFSLLLQKVSSKDPPEEVKNKGDDVWPELTVLRDPFLDAAGKALNEPRHRRRFRRWLRKRFRRQDEKPQPGQTLGDPSGRPGGGDSSTLATIVHPQG